MTDQQEHVRRMYLSLDRLARLVNLDPPAPAVIIENERRILERRVEAFPCSPEVKQCVDEMEANIAKDAAEERRLSGDGGGR